MPVDYKQYPVLFVDDEPQNLVVFRYAMEDNFSVLTASSGADALRVLEQREIGVLLADQRMPGMSGSELCARAREIQPDAVRIIITAYADIHAAINAINQGQHIDSSYSASYSANAVPEPATLLTFGLGTAALAAHRRRRAKRQAKG